MKTVPGNSTRLKLLRLWARLLTDQRGQALPLVLALLAFGGLALTPLVNFVASSIAGIKGSDVRVRGHYAADAGIEYVLWSILNQQPLPTELPENINQMAVTIQTENKGNYAVYLGELTTTGQHSDYLDVSGDMVWDDGAQAYQYTITVTWQPGSGSPSIHFQQVGARLPRGYGYTAASAGSFPDNLSLSNPVITTDASGAETLSWGFSSPHPSVDNNEPVRTERFYITGTGSLTGDYAWVVADRSDIGTVSDVTGTLYSIIVTATNPTDGAITAQTSLDVIVDAGGGANVVSWQIIK